MAWLIGGSVLGVIGLFLSCMLMAGSDADDQSERMWAEHHREKALKANGGAIVKVNGRKI